MPANIPLWQIATRLYFAVITAFIAMYVPQAILPELMQAFEISKAQAGLSISALIGSIAIASLVVGPVSDRFGRKPVILTAASLAGLPALLIPFVSEWWQLLSLRSLQGLLIPAILSVAIAYIAESFPESQRRFAIGGYIAATVTGGLLSRIISGSITYYVSWHYAFAFSGVLFLLCALTLISLPRSQAFSAPDSWQTSVLGMFGHLKRPILVAGFLIGFALFYAFTAVFTYLPFYLSEPPFNFSPLKISFMYLVYASGIISAPLAGYYSKRFGFVPIIILGLIIVMFAQVASSNLIIGFGTFSLIVALAVLTFGSFIAQSGATAYVATTARNFKAGASALYLFCYYIGGGLGAFLPGVFWQRFGWWGVVGSSLTLILIAICVFLITHSAKNKQ